MWSLCDDDHVDENPIPPAAIPRRKQALHLVELRGVDSRAVASSCITTRRNAEWPTRNPAFGISVPSRRSRYSLGRRPVPRHALLERLQRHALDPGQHPHQVVGIRRVDRTVTGRERRDREAAVAAHHGGHAVQRRRAQRRVPERLRVVVGVDVDEARRDDEVGRVDRPRRVDSSIVPIDVMRPSLIATSARRGAEPVPSTTMPPRMMRSCAAFMGAASR